jgi:hypothetical protein
MGDQAGEGVDRLVVGAVMTEPPPPPSNDGRVLGWLNAVKSLSITNMLVIVMLAVVAVPVYVIYKALDDEKLLDRLLSTYEETSSQMAGCTLRHVQERGGPELWGISSGFAFQGAQRWFISVVLSHEPSNDEIVSFCESLKLIVDGMYRNGERQ